LQKGKWAIVRRGRRVEQMKKAVV